MANSIPQNLPYTKIEEYVAWACERDLSSLVNSREWFTIFAGFGPIDYKVTIALANGTEFALPPGTQGPQLTGVLPVNRRFSWELPENVSGVALAYTCLGTNARLGYAFPQINK